MLNRGVGQTETEFLTRHLFILCSTLPCATDRLMANALSRTMETLARKPAMQDRNHDDGLAGFRPERSSRGRLPSPAGPTMRLNEIPRHILSAERLCCARFVDRKPARCVCTTRTQSGKMLARSYFATAANIARGI